MTTTTPRFMVKRSIWTDQPILLLARTIGNDLPPRHNPNQTLSNLEFILKYEVNMPFLQKHWCINRIFNTETLIKVKALLDTYNQTYTVIPYNLQEYAERDFQLLRMRGMKDAVHDADYNMKLNTYPMRRVLSHIYEPKILYTMNINEMRNLMIEYGIQQKVQWILPWDQNCFLSKNGLAALYQAIQEQGAETKYMITYMERVLDNMVLLDESHVANATSEPQIMFRADAIERFNETLRYGRGDKVSLLTRLGVPGPWWLMWAVDAYQRSLSFENMSLDTTTPHIPTAGFVFRLSAVSSNDGDNAQREVKRWMGVQHLLDMMDRTVLHQIHHFSSLDLVYFDKTRLTNTNSLRFQIVDTALDELFLYPLLRKKKIAPSGTIHDLYQPKEVEDTVPALVVPGFIDESDQFDGVRIQTMLDQVTLFTIAWYISGDVRLYHQAIALLHEWFIDARTYVLPHYRYMYTFKYTKYVCFALDAIRLLQKGAYGVQLSSVINSKIHAWFAALLKSLRDEKDHVYYDQASIEGLYLDLHISSIAAFLNETTIFIKTIHFTRSRLISMFHRHTGVWLLKRTEDIQPVLEAWVIMGKIANTGGVNVWGYKGDSQHAPKESILCMAVKTNSPCCTASCTKTEQSHWEFVLIEARRNCNICTNIRPSSTPLRLWGQLSHNGEKPVNRINNV